jgi:hypothetical protein
MLDSASVSVSMLLTGRNLANLKLSTFQPGHRDTLGLFEEPEVLDRHFLNHQSVTIPWCHSILRPSRRG